MTAPLPIPYERAKAHFDLVFGVPGKKAKPSHASRCWFAIRARLGLDPRVSSIRPDYFRIQDVATRYKLDYNTLCAALHDLGTPLEGYWRNGEDIDRLVRELDVALNGDGAAKQASLVDVVSQVQSQRWKLVKVDAA